MGAARAGSMLIGSGAPVRPRCAGQATIHTGPGALPGGSAIRAPGSGSGKGRGRLGRRPVPALEDPPDLGLILPRERTARTGLLPPIAATAEHLSWANS